MALWIACSGCGRAEFEELDASMRLDAPDAPASELDAPASELDAPASELDARTDAPDAGTADAAAGDAAASSDAGASDAGSADAGSADAGARDAGRDAGDDVAMCVPYCEPVTGSYFTCISGTLQCMCGPCAGGSLACC